MSNSPTVSPFLKECVVYILYTNAKMFADDVLLNHVGDNELKSIDAVGTGRMTKKEIKKDDKGSVERIEDNGDNDYVYWLGFKVYDTFDLGSEIKIRYKVHLDCLAKEVVSQVMD
ncbi:hypothetical protein Tco_0404374 [Tanacetum coccineum]